MLKSGAAKAAPAVAVPTPLNSHARVQKHRNEVGFCCFCFACLFVLLCFVFVCLFVCLVVFCFLSLFVCLFVGLFVCLLLIEARTSQAAGRV